MGSVALLTEAQPWPADGRRASRGRVVVRHQRHQRARHHREPPAQASTEQTVPAHVAPPPVVPWVLSAKSATALASQASRLAEFVSARGASTADDVGWTLAGRDRVRAPRGGARRRPRRLCSPGWPRAGRRRARASSSAARPPPRARPPSSSPARARSGSAWAVSCTPPTRSSPTPSTRRSPSWTGTCCGRCATSCGAHDEDLLDTTEFAQPALFAVEVALFRLLESLGCAARLRDRPLGRRADRRARRRRPVAGERRAARGRARQAACRRCPRAARWSPCRPPRTRCVPLLTDGVGIAAVNGPTSVVDLRCR